MSNQPVILFDLDGTLIDSTEAILESFAESFRHLGGEIPDSEAIKAQIGYPLPTMFAQLHVPPAQIEAYVHAYKEHYRQIHTQKTRLLPRAKEAIELASKFARLGVVTTKTGRYSRELLEHFGVFEAFEVLVGSEDVIHHKPHPEPILTALERMGCAMESARCAMVGDTCLDIRAAHSAGVYAIGVSCGYASKKSLLACGAHLCSDALAAVLQIESMLHKEEKKPSLQRIF